MTEERRLSSNYDLWLKAHDLKEKPWNLRIKAVYDRDVWNQQRQAKDIRAVLVFHGANKQLVLNQTQANAVARIFGDAYDEIAGNYVRLTPKKYGQNWTIAIEAGTAPKDPAA